MILDHKVIKLFDEPAFTWVTMKTPMEGAVPIPSEACMAYIMEGDRHFLLKEEGIKAEPGKMILSLCGYTMSLTIPKQRESGYVGSFVVHFSQNILKQVYQNEKPPYWKELESPVVKYITHTAASDLIKLFFMNLSTLFEHADTLPEDMIILKYKEIIMLLMQSDASGEINQIMRSLFSERTFTFKELVDANLFEPVTVESLAMLTNMSVSSFKSEFKRIYNSTPGEYIREKRTEKVAELLRFSDESVSNIGYQCGFSSPAHLSRAFKSKYGVSPNAYRKNLLQESVSDQ